MARQARNLVMEPGARRQALRFMVRDRDTDEVFQADGLRVIRVGNLCCGGPDGTVVYIASSSRLYKLPTKTRGTALWVR